LATFEEFDNFDYEHKSIILILNICDCYF
jgi:hypothetical protein